MWAPDKALGRRLISADYTDYADFGFVAYSRSGTEADRGGFESAPRTFLADFA
jgi:hypothetical protein